MKQIQAWNANKGKWENKNIEDFPVGMFTIKIIEVERELLDMDALSLMKEAIREAENGKEK